MAFNKTNEWYVSIPTSKDYAKPPSGTYRHPYQFIDNKIVEIKEVIVYRFIVGDVEDPDLYAGEPLYKWQQSEMGQWVMEHAIETPVWHRFSDPVTFGHKYAIRAKLSGKDLTYFYLKWQDSIDKPLR